MKHAFKPEFLNRIDARIVFHSLREDQIRQIVDLMLKRVQNQLVEQEITLETTDEGKAFLVEKGYDAAFGARPLRRAIQTYIEDPLAEGMLTGRFHPGDTVVVTRQENELVMEAKPREGAEREELAIAEAEG
jgi:ATP-dependent Clp protease ATP-binding subunit ClpC